MKYKTIIEIVSEAEDKNEAMEIVGEYLSGNIVSGVEMKCLTKRSHTYNNTILSVLVISAVLLTAIFTTVHTRPTYNSTLSLTGTDAMQLPLRTSNAARRDARFKKAWENKKTQEALNYIKR